MKSDADRIFNTVLVIACGLAAALSLVFLSRRVESLERRVSDLENKPCLMTGAHTGCKKVER